MTDTPEENPEAYAKFTFANHGFMRTLRVKYQGCLINFSFPVSEAGTIAANNLAESFPRVWTAALTEQGITDEMDGIDDELNDLLGGDADE